jgi:hypothetical protein
MINDKQQSKLYRKAIREAWLAVVGRAQLTSAEYAWINEWLEGGIALDLIVRAIRQCAERAKVKGITVVSLGVIRADLVTLQRKQASSQVGAQSKRVQWRESWARDLPQLIEEYGFTGNAEAVQLLKQLQSDLPKLAEDQARARLHEFNQRFK